VMTHLKQSIEITERANNPSYDSIRLNELLDLELEGRESLTEPEEVTMFNVLQGAGSGKAITNLSEYLLMTQAMKGEIKVSVLSPPMVMMMLMVIMMCVDLRFLVPLWAEVFRAGVARPD
jgi:hypothetical protein